MLILDCDVHQGNGTADIFSGDPSVYTFSIHGANNFPFRRGQSDLDIALPDGTRGSVYLDALRGGLERSLGDARPDLVIYLAGADPFKKDRYGKLALTTEDLAERDRLVFERCRSAGLPVATVMSGGYASDVNEIVDIHFATVSIAGDYASA